MSSLTSLNKDIKIIDKQIEKQLKKLEKEQYNLMKLIESKTIKQEKIREINSAKHWKELHYQFLERQSQVA